MKYAWYIAGMVLALVPSVLFSLTLNDWIEPWQEHVAIAAKLLNSGHPAEAVPEFAEALQVHPDYRTHIDLGVALDAAGRLPEAMVEFQQAADLQPATADAYFLLGNSLARMGRTDEAISNYETVLRLDPGNKPARWSLGALLLREGKIDVGLAQFVAVAQDAPEDAQAHYNLGNAYFGLARAADAEREYRLALQLNPGDPAVLNKLTAAKAAEAAQLNRAALPAK